MNGKKKGKKKARKKRKKKERKKTNEIPPVIRPPKATAGFKRIPGTTLPWYLGESVYGS